LSDELEDINLLLKAISALETPHPEADCLPVIMMSSTNFCVFDSPTPAHVPLNPLSSIPRHSPSKPSPGIPTPLRAPRPLSCSPQAIHSPSAPLEPPTPAHVPLNLQSHSPWYTSSTPNPPHGRSTAIRNPCRLRCTSCRQTGRRSRSTASTPPGPRSAAAHAAPSRGGGRGGFPDRCRPVRPPLPAAGRDDRVANRKNRCALKLAVSRIFCYNFKRMH
jgi:hypothetical protein